MIDDIAMARSLRQLREDYLNAIEVEDDVIEVPTAFVGEILERLAAPSGAEETSATGADSLTQTMIDAINTNPISRRAFARLADLHATGAGS